MLSIRVYNINIKSLLWNVLSLFHGNRCFGVCFEYQNSHTSDTMLMVKGHSGQSPHCVLHKLPHITSSNIQSAWSQLLLIYCIHRIYSCNPLNQIMKMKSKVDLYNYFCQVFDAQLVAQQYNLWIYNLNLLVLFSF